MYTLRMLGVTSLSDDTGREAEALLRQPKQVALIAYLAVPRPGVWHRRDALLGMFWPDLDQGRARSALRSALYTLRRHLPEGAVRSRGDDEVSLDPDIVVTDVMVLTDQFAAGRYHEANDAYRGELLPGLYLSDSSSFEKWLSQERQRMQSLAVKSAARLADLLGKEGNIGGAIEAATRATELAPDDEAGARRLIALLDLSGDRSQAFAVYERFRNHMSESFGVRPSAETVALLDAIRTRHTPGVVASDNQLSHPVRMPEPDARLLPAVARKRDARWAWIALPIAAAGLLWIVPHSNEVAARTSHSLIILPTDNETGDPRLSYVATGIADDVGHRLEGAGGLRIRSGARSDWSTKTRHDIETIGHQLGSTILLRSAIRRVGDSLEVYGSVIDASTMGERPIPAQRFTTLGIKDVEGRLAASVIGAVFRQPIPPTLRSSGREIDPESYRLMLEGWHLLLSNTAGPQARLRSKIFFDSAISIDPLNARAWSGLSSLWAILTVSDQLPFDDGYERASAAAMRALAIDTLQGSAWANLAILRALKFGDLKTGLELTKKAETAEPSNPEIYHIKSSLFRYAHQYDKARDAARVARELDPLSPYFAEREASIEFCASRPEAALRIFESEHRASPRQRLALDGMTRAYAQLGRYEEAITSWRALALVTGDTALSRQLQNASGEDYWTIRHLIGRKRLTAIRRSPSTPLRLMQAAFAAGDSSTGFAALNEAMATGTRALYRLSCMPDLDEFRTTPRLTEAIRRIGTIRVN